jgi:peroxiredoxin
MRRSLRTAATSSEESDDATTLSLNEKLAAFRAKDERQFPQFAQAYDRLVAHLEALTQDRVGPAVGDRMPDFLLPDQTGTLLSLRSMLPRGPVVISFNRGHWCPYCKIDLRGLAAIAPQVGRLGGRIVSIMPDNADAVTEAVADGALPFPILSDVDLGYSLLLGLVYWIGADMTALYQQVGIELERYHGNGSHFLPMAAKFVVGPDGLVKARQVDVEFRQRMEPEAVLAALRDF